MPVDKKFKVGAVVTELILKRTYMKCAIRILEPDFVTPLPRARKQRQKYKIIKALPQHQDYLELRKTKFTTTVGELVENAMSELECLKDELQEWYDNLPEAFQSGDKGETLQSTIQELEGLSAPDISPEHAALKVLFVPDETGSRSARCAEARRMLEEAAEAIRQNETADEIDEIASAIECLEFPGMY